MFHGNYQRAKLSKELRIQDHIKFIGKISHSEIPELMSKCNIYAHPSVWEPFSASLMEAQASGRVSVVTNTGGNPEIVINDETGYLLEGEPDLFADKITMLLLDKDKAKMMSENARRKIEERFSWEEEAKGYLNLYHEVLNNKRGYFK